MVIVLHYGALSRFTVRSTHQCCMTKEWRHGSFEKTTLKHMGLRIQLGHTSGERCAHPQRAFGDDFVIIDVHGVHDVALDYCGCEYAEVKHVQLLRFRLFPATSIGPKTACTFRLLEFYHLLHNQTKASGFEFYTTLARRSNNTGTEEVKVRTYDTFATVFVP